MSIRVISKENEESLFWDHWQRYIAKHRSSPRYLKTTVEYYLAVMRGAGDLYKDASFVYLMDGEPVACVFLPIIRQADNFIIAMRGDYVFAPLCNDLNAQQRAFALIDDIARQNNVSKIAFSIDPLEDKDNQFNYLQTYGYLGAPILTYMVDLTGAQSAEDLMAMCHKRHRRSMKEILDNQDFQTFVVDKDNADSSVFENYVALHHKCAGRETRVKKSFDIQFEALKNGNAVLIGLRHKGLPVAYYYFAYSADKAFAFSSADDPDYDHYPLYHVLFLRHMEYLKKMGITKIDAEQPSNPSSQLDYYPDAKQLNIAFFKQGFVGSFVNQMRGIKYFSQKMFEEDLEIFKKNYKIS